jgi:hypothetical protein
VTYPADPEGNLKELSLVTVKTDRNTTVQLYVQRSGWPPALELRARAIRHPQAGEALRRRRVLAPRSARRRPALRKPPSPVVAVGGTLNSIEFLKAKLFRLSYAT